MDWGLIKMTMPGTRYVACIYNHVFFHVLYCLSYPLSYMCILDVKYVRMDTSVKERSAAVGTTPLFHMASVLFRRGHCAALLHETINGVYSITSSVVCLKGSIIDILDKH